MTLTDKIVLGTLGVCERWRDVSLFVLNQRVFARRGQPFTATFIRRIIDKTSLASAITALRMSPPRRTSVVSWPVIMRSPWKLLKSGPLFINANQGYGKRMGHHLSRRSYDV